MFPLLIFLLVVLRPSTGGAATLPLSSAADTAALLFFKSSLSDPSNSLSSWSPSTSPCSWLGVTCSSAAAAVVSLNLSSVNLSGAINVSSLSSLQSLVYLNLSNNLFNYSLPPSLISLSPNLETLDLYNNNLTGELPVALPANLRHLHLGGNFFSGEIPPSYSDLSQLRYLALSGNSLTGSIPKNLSKLSHLRELYLGYYNVFDGGIPPELCDLDNLVRLDMASCGLSGRIPPELGRLRHLDTLFLQVNSLSGEIPPELGNLKSLKSMDISNNLLIGVIPSAFAELRNLTLLNLFRNKLHGDFPEFIGDLPALEVLQLWDNNFTGVVPAKLGSGGKLRLLDVSSNKLTGTLPQYLCSGGHLQTLIVLSNFLFGSIPDSIGRCKSLSRIRMGSNYLNGSISAGILSLPNLTQLELQENLLSGVFPDTGDAIISPNLGEINLSNNRLAGPLPPAIGNFSGVQKLLLNNNLLSGSIPSQVGRLRQLSKLDFSGNRFSGEITPDISKCKLLTYIDLSRNNLSGEIPEVIGEMRILNFLNLSRNELRGNIPALFGEMQSLTGLDLSYNKLTGLVPGSGQFSYFNATSFVGNPDLCGPYVGPCRSGSASGNPARPQTSLSPSVKLLIVVALLVCSIAFAIVAVLKTRSIKKANRARSWKLAAFQRLEFSCDDVLDSLKEENIIGKGGAGIVYRGVMPNGEQVAVKRLPANIMGSSSNDHGFSAEIQTLGRIRHRHIVRLLGFCSNHETNLLVYEYMPNGSLGEVLHGKKGGHLHWDLRYKIAVEAAKGLCYLHHDCSPLIIHRDVKSNNILLDSNFEAHVADFGLAKFLQDSGTSECMSAIAGSYGYIAPEYAYTLKVDEKTDVYSFGVVLLELLCGRKPVGEFGEGVDIVQWVRNITNSNKDAVIQILDPRLPTIPLPEAMHVFYVAMLCVEEHSIARPTMREVVQILSEIPKPASTSEDEVSDKQASANLAVEVAASKEVPQSPPPDLLSI